MIQREWNLSHSHLDISDNNHLKLLKSESATFYDVLDTLATQGMPRAYLSMLTLRLQPCDSAWREGTV